MTAPQPWSGESAGSGDPRVDQVLADLTAVAEAPAADQVEPLSEAHRVLRETLNSIDDV